MALYYTKHQLYREIEQIRRFFFPNSICPNIISAKDVLNAQPNLKIEEVPFTNRALRGMLYYGRQYENDVILLNSSRTPYEQNFDCAHELVHLLLHRNEDKPSFTCTDDIIQDSFLEWHANEGGAQFLLPYQDFIPNFVDCLTFAKRNPAFRTYEYLSDYYSLTPQVIRNRLDSLCYEIDQYVSGVSIKDIEVLSKRQRDNRGITSTCYSTLFDFPLEWDSEIG